MYELKLSILYILYNEGIQKINKKDISISNLNKLLEKSLIIIYYFDFH